MQVTMIDSEWIEAKNQEQNKRSELVRALNALQGRFFENRRVLRDIDHLIEFGDKLSQRDAHELFLLHKEKLQERRQMKDVFTKYMPKEFHETLFNQGVKFKGHYLLDNPNPVNESSRLYTLRSGVDSDQSVIDYLNSIAYSEDKFKNVRIPASKAELNKLREVMKYGN